MSKDIFENIEGVVIPQGFTVTVNNLACVEKNWVQYRFPKSKKKRIRNKWFKRRENFKWVEKHMMIKSGNTIMVSQRIFDLLKNNAE